MKTLYFETEPTHIELWDACVTQLLYNEPDGSIPFYKSINDTFAQRNAQKLFDVCAGSGFPALHLREKGYEVDCIDMSEEAISVFQKNARKSGVDDTIWKGRFTNLGEIVQDKTYDGIICKATIWYADGGYCEKSQEKRTYTSTKAQSLCSIEKALKGFYTHLNEGGILYIDKYADDQTAHFEKVAQIAYGSELNDLYFNIRYENGLRLASTTRVTKSGETKEDLCVANMLHGTELEALLSKAGFSAKKTKIAGEKFFDTWVCEK